MSYDMAKMSVQDMEYMWNAWERFLSEKDSTAVLSDSPGNRLTRAQADDISGRIYAYLKKNGIGKEDFVLINLERGVKPILAMMGVLKNGSAFAVTEASYPEERKKFIYDDCKAKFEINDGNWDAIIAEKPLSGFEITDPHDACFCIYTSGTTGTPKGVVHEYGQIKLEMLSEQTAPGEWRGNADTRWGLVAPLNFVASVKTVIHFLYTGVNLHILDYNTVKDPKKLKAYFLKNRINGTFLPPSMLRKFGSDLGPFLKLIYTGSEDAGNVFVQGAELLNIYTMSESMFTVTRFLIDRPYPAVPLGTPAFDLPIKLIDGNGSPVADGETGELCFYDPYCRGYIHNQAENEKHFCGGWFHTGDLAVFRNGQYYLKGRSDDMLKINGNRVEPLEIEAACRKLLPVSECAAKVFEEGFAALYYTDAITLDEREARRKLEKVLPYYMIPSYFIRLEKMPLTDSGKIDRKRLKVPADFYQAEYQAPRDAFEERLAKAFSEVLGVKKIGICDDFFQMGGSSIMVMELLNRLDEDDILTPTLIYKGRTIEEIHRLYLAEKANHLTVEEKEREGRRHKYPLSENALWYWRNVNDASIDFYTALKFSALIPSGIIVKRLNNYIAKNSTFNMVLEAGENGVPLQVYTPETPYVRLEPITKAELERLKANFVRPFGFGEPLIRLRAYRCGRNTYVFIHAFHMVTDGAGFHLLLEDLKKCLLGKETENVCYFSWAFEEKIRNDSPVIDENRRFFRETYFDRNYDICIRADKNTGSSGFGTTRPAAISLNAVKAHCNKAGISVNNFLVAATALAQCTYNHTDTTLVSWNFNNRGPKDNHAGVMIRTCYFVIDRKETAELTQVYDSVKKQNEEILPRLYEHEYYIDFERAQKEPTLSITYLVDWFSEEAMPCAPVKTVELKNSTACSADSEKVFCLVCTHQDGNLLMTLQYGLSYLKPQNAERFIAVLENTAKEMLSEL